MPETLPLSYRFAKKHHIFATIGLSGDYELFCTKDAALESIAEARRHLDQGFTIALLDSVAFEQKLSEAYHNSSANTDEAMLGIETADLRTAIEVAEESKDLLEQQDDAPIIKLINAMLIEAIKQHASDIHIEPYEHELLIRFRIDGILQTIVKPKKELAALIASRIKVLAHLDIAEKRIPQDGRISLTIGGRQVDVRVSTIPTEMGERVVLRILDREQGLLSLEELGMGPEQMAQISGMIAAPHGILLVVGPTGSGKSTSLYSMLSRLDRDTRNVMTIEDPVEYRLPMVSQTQVNTKTGMTFAKGLRSLLRQDPDVVMVGEIRDAETAEIAVQASLTGHLVFSTLHTNNAIGAVVRLQDIGIEPFLLVSSLLGVVSQRLVRRLCDECKEPYSPSEHECERLQLDPIERPTIYRANSCVHCEQKGYQGRVGIFEVLQMNEELREMVRDGAGEGKLAAYIQARHKTMLDDAREKILLGVTSVDEVLRVIES